MERHSLYVKANKFFNSTAAPVAGKEPAKMPGIYRTTTLLQENNITEQFEL